MEKLRPPPELPGLPPREIIYQRSGNLATTTRLDEEKAQIFMLKSDMRRDIVIGDSDKRAEHEVTQVGKDILAFETIAPLRKLTEIVFWSKPLYTLTLQDDQFEIQVHERQIDQNVRLTHYVDRDDYNGKFLELLNKAVKAGVSQSLFQEKLGWQDQSENYLANIMYVLISRLSLNTPGLTDELSCVGALFLILNPFVNLLDRIQYTNLLGEKLFIPPRFQNRNWKEIWLPSLPVDKWVAGRIFLARYGQHFIVPQD